MPCALYTTHMNARIVILLLACLLAGAPALAEDASTTASTTPQLQAGFAPALWLSVTDLTDGDSVKVYTVVYDASTRSIEGDVIFMVDGSAIGTTHFSLAAGASGIESVAWKARAGTHAFTASVENAIEKGSKEPASIENLKAGPVSVTVEDAPPPSRAVAAATAAAHSVSRAVEAATPVVSSVVTAATNMTESVRTAGADYLAGKMHDGAGTSSGQVLGAETYRGEDGPADAGTGSTIAHRAYAALYTVFASPALFYFIAIVLLLAFFWFIARRFSSRAA